MSNHYDDKLEHVRSNDDNQLQRQVTISISPEQYERMFFQPSPARGDLSKRLGNPTLLGIFGFLLPLQFTSFCLCGLQGSSAASTIGSSGLYYTFGGGCMFLAGIAEFILGNTYPFVLFITYGAHLAQFAYNVDPLHDLTSVYGADGAATVLYNSGSGFYNVCMTLVSFVFFLGSLRTNGPLCGIIFLLIPFFAISAGASFYAGHHPTAAGAEHAAYLQVCAGGVGFAASLLGWYLAIIAVCASTGVPCPLPIFDLSSKVFPTSDAAADERAGAGGSAVAHSKA